jgi:O-antigen/teichoic acid export membrane protein
MNVADPKQEKLRSKAASSARWMTVATATRVVAQLLQLFILGRLLDPEDFGLMAMVTVVLVFGQTVGDAGISNAIIHYQDAKRRELSSLYWLNVMAGAVVFAALLLSAPLVADLYDEPRLTGLVTLASFALLIAPFGHQFQVLHEKELLFRRLALIEISAAVAGLIVAVSCALRGQGVHSLVWGLLGGAAVKALLLGGAGWVRWRPELRFRWNECRRFFRFGAFQMAERVCNQVGTQMDRLLLGIMVGARPLGFYNVAHNLALRPYLLINPIVTRVAFPVFARVQTRDDQLRSGFLQMIELIAAVLIPLYTALVVLAEPIIHVGPSAKWAASVPLLQILGLVGMVLSLGNPVGSLILAKGRPGLAVAINALRIVLDIIAITIAARFGLRAVAIAVLIVRAGIMFPLGFGVRWMLVRMRPLEYLSTIAPFFASSAIMGAAMYAVSRWIDWPMHVVELVVGLVVGCAVYVAVLLLWQRDRVTRIWSNVKS